jgi:hypothetical protein
VVVDLTPPLAADLTAAEAEDVVDDWEAWESRRCSEVSVGACAVGWSGIEMSLAPLKLPWRAIDPTPGVDRSGIGGGAVGGCEPPTGAGREPAGIDGADSSVGLAETKKMWLMDYGQKK